MLTVGTPLPSFCPIFCSLTHTSKTDGGGGAQNALMLLASTSAHSAAAQHAGHQPEWLHKYKCLPLTLLLLLPLLLSCLQARKQVADQQLEIAEVMGMCDTLLSEREKLKGGQ